MCTLGKVTWKNIRFSKNMNKATSRFLRHFKKLHIGVGIGWNGFMTCKMDTDHTARGTPIPVFMHQQKMPVFLLDFQTAFAEVI